MKYQIGDRVIVRNDLNRETLKLYFMEDHTRNTGDNLPGWSLTVVDGMRKYFGEEVEIVDIWGEGSGLHGAYVIEHPVYGRDAKYGWTDDMFEGYAAEPVEYAVGSLEELL